MRTLLALVVALLIAFGLVWFLAGRAAGPAITLAAPTKVLGQQTPLTLEVYAPGGTRHGPRRQPGAERPADAAGLAGAAAGPQVRARVPTG